MTRHVRRASALILAGALFSAGAWGQSTMLQQSVGMDANMMSTKIAVASEYFGAADGRELGRDAKGGMEPMVVLTVMDNEAVQGTGSIGVDNIARITYTVTGGTFAETVSSSSLTASTAGDIQTEIVDGGAAGDASVTIEVETLETLNVNDTLTFAVPMLQATGAVLSSDPATGKPTAVGVKVVASIAVRRSTSNPFPSAITGSGTMPAGAITVADSQVYDTMMPALMLGWTNTGSTAEVDVKDRKVIISLGAMTRDPTALDPSMAAAGLRIGTINISAGTPVPMDLGGKDAAVMTMEGDPATARDAMDYELGDGLSGDADVTVSGPFQSGDMVYIGKNAMTIGNGSAMGSVDIEMLLQSAGMDVIYVPGGMDDLKPSTFMGSAMLDFDAADNSSSVATAVPATGMLAYRGFSNQGYAYGVVRGGGIEQSRVRIGCTSAMGCNVFVDCTDHDGMPYFGELASIGGFATSVVGSDDIAAALGGGWSSGRGSCSLVSNAGLEVQHMVRSGDALINNSVVINKPIAGAAPAAAATAAGPATYDCVPADGNDDGKADADYQTCTPQAQ